MTVSDQAHTLHKKMVELPTSTLFTQAQLQELLLLASPVELLNLAQELINNNLIKLVKHNEELKFQAISQTEATKISSMSEDEAMIYSYIEASGREGIWTKTIKAKTNLHQHIVVRCLKSLENQRYIKSIKSVKHPTRKIYMLYNLQPSIEVTGGPWFTDSELDTEFIDSLLTVIWRFVASKSFPTAFTGSNGNINESNPVQASFPYNHSGFANLDMIMDFITANKITNIELAINDIRALCDVLTYDDKLELVAGSGDVFKATWQSVLEAGYGRSYMEDNTTGGAKLKETYGNEPFSIFEGFCAPQPTLEQDPDIVYLDAWMNS